ncbi:DUF1631 family protein [Gilvimarinus polysaccharolyticus]|uniref:DUF1631 family protein n=1 Tax=Gilvimarinus polysaccharolyticus TaxID=863921 RepID=UPI0006731EA5|nr:DUF1631 family protein [Gilvimarinus polysaccharolyticus]
MENDGLQFSAVRKLFGLDSLTVPATVADISALGEEFYRADDSWIVYRELPFAKKAGLSGYYAAWLWRALSDNVLCDPKLEDARIAIVGAIVSYVASNDALSLAAVQKNRKAFDQCFFHLRTWYPDLGPVGRKFTERLDVLVDALQGGVEQWDAALATFNLGCGKELDRAAMLAKRMQASELGEIKIAHAEQRVTQIYNDVVALHPLPESTLDLIDNIVLPNLQYLLINESEQAPDWSYWVRILRLIVWSVNPDKSSEDRQAFFNKGPVLLAQLEDGAVNKACSDNVYRDYVDEFSSHIITLLKGQAIETVTAPKRRVSAEVESLSQLQSGGVEHHFSAGDWLGFDNGDTLIRCQFLMQAPGTDTLLFVNRAGHKVLQKTVEQMSACFDAGIAEEIPKVPALSAALSAVNARMAALQERVATQARAQHEEREKLRRHKQALAQIKSRELLAKQAAEAKARAEVERLAVERAAREKLAKVRQMTEAREAREQQMRDTLDGLTLGTWADLPLSEGKTVRCKLAVSMRSTSKYIFVDRVGSKVAELLYDDLLGYLMRDEAVFYKPEQGFENRLETIVRGLRRTE